MYFLIAKIKEREFQKKFCRCLPYFYSPNRNFFKFYTTNAVCRIRKRGFLVVYGQLNHGYDPLTKQCDQFTTWNPFENCSTSSTFSSNSILDGHSKFSLGSDAAVTKELDSKWRHQGKFHQIYSLLFLKNSLFFLFPKWIKISLEN